MQDYSSLNKGKEPLPTQNPHANSRDFYNYSVLRPNSLIDMCNDLSGNEVLDINVEKFLCEIADNFIETVIDTACQVTKHKKSDTITISDIAYAMDKNFEIYEPSRYANHVFRQKSQEIKHNSTADHKRRVELTREETKNINF